jgi:two-component system heavy metal sensor histidine kinase CusS
MNCFRLNIYLTKLEINLLNILNNNKKNEPSSTTSLYVITSDTSIANEHLDSLFERFYQCISSRHQSSQTGGLGLSIVASIMTLHQGEYLAYNTPDGICFELIFPNDCDK